MLTPAAILDFIEKLKAAGVTHFKQGDLELTLLPDSPKTLSTLKPVSLETPPSEPETQPPHIVQEMTSLLKLSNEDLMERIFPLAKPGDEGLN